MKVMVKSCKIGENGTAHKQIWTEAAVEFGLSEKTRFWRAVRVKYLDSEASLGSGAKDKGKTLETAQVCNSDDCGCDKSHWYRWLLEEGKIKWASFSSDDEEAEKEEKEGKQKEGSGVSIGPIPNNPERNATMTIKAFNVLNPVGNMYFVPKNDSAAQEATNVTSLASTRKAKRMAKQKERREARKAARKEEKRQARKAARKAARQEARQDAKAARKAARQEARQDAKEQAKADAKGE